MIDCVVCHQSLANIRELQLHLSIAHVAFSPFICNRCTFAQFPTYETVCDHYRQCHHLDNFQVIELFG
jgi:hypothetical protein